MALQFGIKPQTQLTLEATESPNDFCLVAQRTKDNPLPVPEPKPQEIGQTDFWADAEVISVYTRTQAIEDGTLVDLTTWASSGPDGMLNGFTIPVAVTASVWADINDIPKSKNWQDIRGRAHDVLGMARMAANGAEGVTVLFQVIVDLTRTRKRTQTYKMVVGPGDNAEPVITIMQPDED
jgi:hypothetical protein